MNFVGGHHQGAGMRAAGICAALFAVILVSLGLLGCGDNMRMPSEEEIAAFEKVDIAEPLIDMTRVRRAELHMGPYLVVPGDVLEFTMPVLLRAVTAGAVQAAQDQTSDDKPYTCRVNDEGAIILPAVGEIRVAGRSLMQIEKQVIAAYHEYSLLKPSVFIRVVEYRTANVYVTGGVEKPGVYALRTDQMTLAHLLTEAGGIHKDGATLIRIVPAGQTGGGSAQATDVPARPGAVPEEYVLTNDGTTSVVFVPEEEGSTMGRVILSVGGRTASNEPVNIGNHVQRWAMLNNLAALAPSIPILDLESRLTDLANRHRQDPPGQAEEGPRKSLRLVSLGQEPGGAGADAVPASRREEIAPEWQGATVLPVHDLNVPFANIALAEGDTVVVEKVQTRQFAVLGLVKSPGNFEYPSDVTYNLAQAIAFAGGLDPVAAPRYVTVYRLFEDGSVGRLPVKLLDNFEFTEAWHVPIRPGDVIAVESTPRTRFNSTIHSLLRINTGVYITGSDLWNND